MRLGYKLMNGDLRSAREGAGLTQAELAERAGVSRQMVGAIEAGRNVPAVDAALRLARAVGSSVEELFGQAPEAVSVLGDPLREGEAVVAGRIGDRLAAAPLASLVAGDAAWAAPDGVVEHGAVRLLPGAPAAGFVVVGCDPALGLCASLLNRGPHRLVAVEGTSRAARAALAAGRTHAAVVHGPADHLGGAPAGTRRIHLARWRVGIAETARGARREPQLDAVLAAPRALIQRAESAASQEALRRAAARAGHEVPPAATRAAGHIDAARRAVLTGRAAVTFEPAAHQHGLGFLALETHDVELWVDERWTDHPGARALGDLLASAAFRRRVGLVGGYDLTDSGLLRTVVRRRGSVRPKGDHT